MLPEGYLSMCIIVSDPASAFIPSEPSQNALCEPPPLHSYLQSQHAGVIVPWGHHHGI